MLWILVAEYKIMSVLLYNDVPSIGPVLSLQQGLKVDGGNRPPQSHLQA
jgi:hypothetical protein